MKIIKIGPGKSLGWAVACMETVQEEGLGSHDLGYVLMGYDLGKSLKPTWPQSLIYKGKECVDAQRSSRQGLTEHMTV